MVTEHVDAPDREFAKQSREIVSGRPSTARDEVLLTYDEKLATLERGRLSILSELATASEGRATRAASGRRLQLLDEFEEVKEVLHVKNSANQPR